MNVRDIEYNPSVDPSVLEKAKAWFEKNKKSFSGVANYAIFNTKGEFVSYTNLVCHRMIRDTPLQDRHLVVSEVGVKRSGLDRKLAETFVRWWLNDSYMGRFILNRDDIDFVLDNGIIVSAEMPATLLQNIMIVSRHFVEIPQRSFKKFSELVEKGIDGNLAYQCCFNTGYSGGYAGDTHVVISAYSHRATGCPPLYGLRNFMAGELGTACKKSFGPLEHYTNSTNYVGGSAFFLDADKYDPAHPYPRIFAQDMIEGYPEVREALSVWRKERAAGTVYSPPNPFKPGATTTPRGPGDVTYEELFDFYLPYIMKHGLPPEKESNPPTIVNKIAA